MFRCDIIYDSPVVRICKVDSLSAVHLFLFYIFMMGVQDN